MLGSLLCDCLYQLYFIFEKIYYFVIEYSSQINKFILWKWPAVFLLYPEILIFSVRAEYGTRDIGIYIRNSMYTNLRTPFTAICK